jgi:hypothetical protein
MSLEQTSLSEQNLESVMQAFEHEGASVRASMRYLMQDKEAIAAGLLLCLSFLKGQQVEDVLIEELKKVEPAQFNQGLIDFQLLCSIDGGAINIGIVVLQEPEASEVCAALNRLFSYKDFGLNRLCILRSAELIENTPQIQNYLPRLLSPEIGGGFVDLQAHALEIILTTLFVFRGRRKYLINAPHISSYLEKEHLLRDNSILRDLIVTIQI